MRTLDLKIEPPSAPRCVLGIVEESTAKSSHLSDDKVATTRKYDSRDAWMIRVDDELLLQPPVGVAERS